jgi:outer membrane lipopolysaccharide assembly protein LptE/RlpB
MWQDKKIIVVMLVVSISLIGCADWYLRGTRPNTSSIKSVHLKAVSAENLRRAMLMELSYGGVKVTTKKAAQVILELNHEIFDRRVLSVDPDTGKVREVEMALEVGFSVRTNEGTLLSPLKKLNWVQDFVFDEDSLLGTIEQESTIRRELAEDAAATIVRRLQSVGIDASPS